MKAINLFVFILLISTVVSAHSLEKKVIIRSDGEFNVQFSTDPEYPVTGKNVHFDVVIWDNSGKVLTNLNMMIEMQKNGEAVSLRARETEPGHYSIEYEAAEFGVYELSPIINNQKIDIQFELYIDAFWPRGMVPVGTIVVLLFIMLLLMYKDCKRRK